MRRGAGALGAFVLALALTGCRTEVGTDVTVTGPAESEILVSVLFDGEAAEELRGAPALQEQVERVFQARTEGEVDESDSDEGLRYSTGVTYEELTGAADVLGVESAALSGTGEEVTLTATLVTPTALQGAIVDASAGQPDADALVDTVNGTTDVTLTVRYPGGVQDATAPEGVEVVVEGDTVTFTQPLGSYRTGTVTVVGDPTASWAERVRTPVLVLTGLLGLAGAAVLVRRSRRPERPRSLPQ